MRRHILKALAIGMLATVSGGISSVAQAETAAEFYSGKNIKFIVPYKPGGGYDEYARLIEPYLEKHSGARVDIVNISGSGGMKGASEIFNAPTDGLTIGIINGAAMVTSELAEIEGAAYKVAEYNFLGRVVADHRVLAVSTKSGLETYADMLASDKPVLLGATGLGGSTYVDAVILAEVMGNNQKVIHGFTGSSEVRQALLRGDIHGMWGSWGSARKGVKSGDFRILVHGDRNGNPNTADVPTVFEFGQKTGNPDHADEVLGAWEALSLVGRPVAAPPGVPEDRIAYLQTAFENAMKDPEFLEKANQAGRDLSFLDGAGMKAIAKSATELSPDIKALFVAAIRGEL